MTRTSKVWDVASGKLIKSMPQPDRVYSLALSPMGKYSLGFFG